MLNSLCYGCEYLKFIVIDKNRKKYYCKSYPNGLPERAFFKNDEKEPVPPCIYENKEIQLKEKNLQKPPELVFIIENFVKNRSKETDFQKNSPEVPILDEMLSDFRNNEKNEKFIQTHLKMFGIYEDSLFFIAKRIIEEAQPKKLEKLHQIIEQADIWTALNIIFGSPYRSKYVNSKNSYNLEWISYLSIIGYLKYKFSSFNLQYKTLCCCICQAPIHPEYLIAYVNGYKNTTLFNSLFPNFSNINDFDICPSHLVIEGYYSGKIEKSRDELKSDVKQLYSLLKFIPPSNFHTNPFIWTLDVALLDLLNIIKHINAMYPYNAFINTDLKSYKKIFGNWLNVLIDSEILDNSLLKTYYGYKCRSKDGHLCNSLVEKIIDEFFVDNNITHEKEPKYPVDDEYNPLGLLRADWLISDNIFVEFFGLSKKENYFKKMEIKLNLAQKHDLNLIALYPKDELRLKSLFKKEVK